VGAKRKLEALGATNRLVQKCHVLLDGRRRVQDIAGYGFVQPRRHIRSSKSTPDHLEAVSAAVKRSLPLVGRAETGTVVVGHSQDDLELGDLSAPEVEFSLGRP